MIIVFHRHFKKDFKKLPKNVQDRFYEILKIFEENQYFFSLNNHRLSGKYSVYRSINITGDYRALYVEYIQIGQVVQFVRIGTHAELYE